MPSLLLRVLPLGDRSARQERDGENACARPETASTTCRTMSCLFILPEQSVIDGEYEQCAYQSFTRSSMCVNVWWLLLLSLLLSVIKALLGRLCRPGIGIMTITRFEFWFPFDANDTAGLAETAPRAAAAHCIAPTATQASFISPDLPQRPPCPPRSERWSTPPPPSASI